MILDINYLNSKDKLIVHLELSSILLCYLSFFILSAYSMLAYAGELAIFSFMLNSA